jgi:tetratricopeptide (TPR) repeat protein
VGIYRQRPLQIIISMGLAIILAGSLSAACFQKAARVVVTPEDIAKAKEAAQEGDIAFSRKDYYAALIKYLDVVRLNPGDTNFFNRLGIIYAKLNLYEEAKGAFQSALRLDSKFSYALNNLGSVFFAQGNLNKAEKHFKKAISLKENEASFHMNLGSVYLEKKKPEKAMMEWRKGLALDPDVLAKSNAVILTGGGGGNSLMRRCYFMARLAASVGNVESAIENLKQAIANGFSDVEDIGQQHDFDPIRNDTRFVEFMQEAPLLIKLRANVGLPFETANPPQSK